MAWPVDYIMGPDATDYTHVERVGDGGQQAYKLGGCVDSGLLKRLWLFNLKDDPTELRDLSAEHPRRVEELSARLRAYRSAAVPPIKMAAREERRRARPVPLHPATPGHQGGGGGEGGAGGGGGGRGGQTVVDFWYDVASRPVAPPREQHQPPERQPASRL